MDEKDIKVIPQSIVQCCDDDITVPDESAECNYTFESHVKMLAIAPVFSKMMENVRTELQKEYEETRIKGAEFAAQIEANIPVMMGLAEKYVIEEVKARMEAELLYIENLKAQAEYQLLCTQEEELRKKGIMERKKLAQDISLSCMQESELSANGVSKRNVDTSQVDLNYTQRAEAVANGISKREQDELNGESKRTLEEIQGTELGLNGTSKRALEAAQTSVAGAQEALYTEQSNSFVKKAQNDAAKTISNMWTIFISEVYGDIGSIPPIVGSGDNMQDMLEDLGRAVDLQIPSSPIPDNPGSNKKKIVKK